MVWLIVFASVAVQVVAQDANLAGPPSLPPMPRYQQVNGAVQLHNLSPVAYFRVLLGMTPAERAHALAEKPADQRDGILRKVTEYESLPSPVREARLHQTELHWMLTRLMRAPVAARTESLRGLSEADQQWLAERLQEWDRLPNEEQKAYLEKQSFLNLYLRWQTASLAGQADIVNKLPPASRTQWTNQLARWQALSESERQNISERLSRFFAMDVQQQQSTVNTLSESERQQMEVSLRAFAQLPLEKRRQCVLSFGKFATMSPDERGQFLRNAARWEEMTPEQRRLWRQLVVRLPVLPPMPPGFRTITPGGLPPMPPGFVPPPAPPAAKKDYAKSTTN